MGLPWAYHKKCKSGSDTRRPSTDMHITRNRISLSRDGGAIEPDGGSSPTPRPRTSAGLRRDQQGLRALPRLLGPLMFVPGNASRRSAATTSPCGRRSGAGRSRCAASTPGRAMDASSARRTRRCATSHDSASASSPAMPTSFSSRASHPPDARTAANRLRCDASQGWSPPSATAPPAAPSSVTPTRSSAACPRPYGSTSSSPAAHPIPRARSRPPRHARNRVRANRVCTQRDRVGSTAVEVA